MFSRVRNGARARDGSSSARFERRRVARLLTVGVVLIGLAFVWRYSPLADWLSVERIVPLLDALSASRWRGPIVIATFVLANVVMFPVTLLIAATAIAFGASSGFFWAVLGSLTSAAAMFGVGHWLGRPMVERCAGERFNAVAERLARGGLVAVFVMRNIPIAPYTLVNFAAGASPIRFRDYLLGTFLGMTPAIAALIFLGDRLRDVWQQPTAANLALLTVAVTVWISLVLTLQRFSNRLPVAR